MRWRFRSCYRSLRLHLRWPSLRMNSRLARPANLFDGVEDVGPRLSTSNRPCRARQGRETLNPESKLLSPPIQEVSGAASNASRIFTSASKRSLGSDQLRDSRTHGIRVLEAIAAEKQRILLRLATGTGKNFIAFRIAWKLFQSRWNLSREPERRPRILFLADRNILANQAYNAFSAFPEDAMVRIEPESIRKKGKVPKNGSLFFTIFQTFMSGPPKDGQPSPYFGEYPPDFFDFIVIDECHRGGANDESTWRDILTYFAPAVQLGLTATPKRKDNVDTYKYFGEPVFIYSLKDGINDGFLTPFKVKQISTTLDEYVYTAPCRQGLWRRPARRDAEDHQCREERSFRCAGICRLRAAHAHPRGKGGQCEGRHQHPFQQQATSIPEFRSRPI